MKKADFPFRWDVAFEISYSHIEEEVEYRTKQGHTLIIGPKGKHHSKGHIYLRLFDSVPEHEVETIARDLLTDTLLVNFLVIDGRSLESGGIRLSNPKLMNANQVQTVPRTVSKGIPAGFAVVAPLDASKVKDAFTLYERRSIHSEKDDMDRCVRLLKEGFGLSDPADRLLSYWRSFNILYGSYANWQSQPAKTSINCLLNIHPRERGAIKNLLDRHNDTLLELANAELNEWRSGISYSKKLHDSLKTANYRDQLRRAVLCVYLVRNEVLHRGESPKEKHEFYVKCGSFLFDLVRMILLSEVGLQPVATV